MTAPAPTPRPQDRSVSMRVNGLLTQVHVDAQLIDETLLPALETVASRPRTGRRALVFVVGPPGVGKSTLAALVVDAARRRSPQRVAVDTVGIDGFHHPNSYLETHHLPTDTGPIPLRAVKGAPETFDVRSLAEHIETSVDRDVFWPTYDRRLHDVVPGTRPVTADVVLVEGNWLLLDEPGWRELAAHAAFVIYVGAEAGLLRERLIERKVRGGLDRDAATEFYERSDRPNVERVTTSSDFSKVDLTLTVRVDGTIEQGDHS